MQLVTKDVGVVNETHVTIGLFESCGTLLYFLGLILMVWKRCQKIIVCVFTQNFTCYVLLNIQWYMNILLSVLHWGVVRSSYAIGWAWGLHWIGATPAQITLTFSGWRAVLPSPVWHILEKENVESGLH